MASTYGGFHDWMDGFKAIVDTFIYNLLQKLKNIKLHILYLSYIIYVFIHIVNLVSLVILFFELNKT